ncbi:uncharacterized protein LOC143300442 isoform X2 [Babylonia areolata]|uniref:uncharacterized protein LOC143300442 isoform X2 n=1 Tax=Babylonia areolata TaxID=304850 RepID=UPI003FD1542F
MSSAKTPGKSVLTLDQRRDYANDFVRLDSNGDGWLSRGEFADWAMGLAGLNVTDKQLEAIFRLVDINEDGKITLDEYYKVLELAHQPPTKNTEAEEIFNMMDRNLDGFLSVDELLAGLHECGYNLTRREVEKFAANLDRDQDGKISMEEFLAAFE